MYIKYWYFYNSCLMTTSLYLCHKVSWRQSHPIAKTSWRLSIVYWRSMHGRITLHPPGRVAPKPLVRQAHTHEVIFPPPGVQRIEVDRADPVRYLARACK